MQTTATRTAGSHTDLLTGILNVQVRNEDKITEQDRQYCQLQQDQLYRTLDRIDRWYDIFKEEAERYREIKSFKYEDNGKVSIRNFYFNNSGEDDYTHNEFKPFDLINELADDVINGSSGMVIGLDRRDVDITEWYNLTLSNAEQIKFYKNGRIDVRFKDSQAAENCYRRLRLDEITLREE